MIRIKDKRGSGILLHISSLPSPYGIGDCGPAAYQFADFLNATHQKYWQILPLNPTDMVYGNSPYSSVSAYAVNTLLISPDLLVKDGWLEESELKARPDFSHKSVDYRAVTLFKNKIFKSAFENFRKAGNRKNEYSKFCSRHKDWLEDFAQFVVLKEHFGGQMFTQWPPEYRDRNPAVLKSFRDQNSEDLDKVKFLQFVFYKQWFELKDYCRKKGVQLIGDVPIYVNDDSVDVWTNPEVYKLDKEKQAFVVAGVPPDYFSVTGQRWGNPVYDWDELKKNGFQWWIKRIQHNLEIFDIVRIDHFRGLIAFWEIPATEKTAVNGRWVQVPYADFFKMLVKKFPGLPLIAEDLGLITPEVTEAMNRFGFPGMKVLLFAFAGDQETHPYLPKNFKSNCVVYTGTHDNNTAKGWFENDMSQEERSNLNNFLRKEANAHEVSWALMEAAMGSVADTAITPLQDVLGLGKESRMNIPGTCNNNWGWRLSPEGISPAIQKRLLQLTKESHRI